MKIINIADTKVIMGKGLIRIISKIMTITGSSHLKCKLKKCNNMLSTKYSQCGDVCIWDGYDDNAT